VAPKHVFSADQPITQIFQDRLHRSGFASKLAGAVCNWNEEESLALAIYGGWGSGKTSLKNLFKCHCKESGDPYIVEFNPWQWSGQDKIFEAFFQQIGTRLGKEDVAAEAAKLAKKWKYFSATWSFGAQITKNFKVGCVAIAAALSIGAASLSPWPWVAGALSILIIVATGLALAIPSLFDALVTFFESKAAYLQKSVEDIRQELIRELKKLHHPIVVIIDDIDRLTESEIRIIFQLIKANTDLPRIVYLLLCQRDIVERALDEVSGNRGADYLKKIIQVGFNVPEVPEIKLHRVLLDSLDEIFGDSAMTRRWDKNRWEDVFEDSLKSYFKTLRDVHRFLGSLQFYANIHKNDGVLEVNPIDLIAIEVIRVFEPEVFNRIKSSAFGKGDDFLEVLFRKEEEGQKIRIAIDYVLAEVKDDARREQLRALIIALFPQAHPKFSRANDSWDKELRICHEQHFHKYFELAVRDDVISAKEFSVLLDASSNRMDLLRRLDALAQRGRIQDLLERFEGYIDELPIENARGFTTALFDFGETMLEGEPSIFRIDPVVQAARLLRKLLARFEDSTSRTGFVGECVRDSNGAIVPTLLVDAEDRRANEQLDDKSLFVQHDLAFLKNLCVQRIRTAASNEWFLKSRHLLTFLVRWSAWGPVDEAAGWVQKSVRVPEAALDLLMSSITRSVTADGTGTRMSYRFYLKPLEPFISFTVLENLVVGIRSSTLTEVQKDALSQFKEAARRKRKDEPYE